MTSILDNWGIYAIEIKKHFNNKKEINYPMQYTLAKSQSDAVRKVRERSRERLGSLNLEGRFSFKCCGEVGRRRNNE